MATTHIKRGATLAATLLIGGLVLAPTAAHAAPPESFDLAVSDLTVALPESQTYDGPGSQRIVSFTIANLSDVEATASRIRIDGGTMGTSAEPTGGATMEFWYDLPDDAPYELLSAVYTLADGTVAEFSGDFAPHSRIEVSYLMSLDIDYVPGDREAESFVLVAVRNTPETDPTPESDLTNNVMWAPMSVGEVVTDLQVQMTADQEAVASGEIVNLDLSIANFGEPNPLNSTDILPSLAVRVPEGWTVESTVAPEGFTVADDDGALLFSSDRVLAVGTTVTGFHVTLIAGEEAATVWAYVGGANALSDAWTVGEINEADNQAMTSINITDELPDEPRIDEPIVDEPVVEEPEVDEPVVEPVEAPIVEEPIVDEPIIEAPVAQQPDPTGAHVPVASTPRLLAETGGESDVLTGGLFAGAALVLGGAAALLVARRRTVTE